MTVVIVPSLAKNLVSCRKGHTKMYLVIVNNNTVRGRASTWEPVDVKLGQAIRRSIPALQGVLLLKMRKFLNELFLETCQHYLVSKLWVILGVVAFLKSLHKCCHRQSLKV